MLDLSDKMKRFQFVWWSGWPGLHFGRWPKDSSWSLIYDWHLFIGWLEIRKWHILTEHEKRELETAQNRQIEQ